LFRVMSSFKATAKGQSVVRPGTAHDDSDQLKYWAPAESVVTQTLVDRLLMLGKVSAQSQSISTDYSQIFSLARTIEVAQADGKTASETLEKMKANLTAAQQALDLKLSVLPESAGLRTAEEIMSNQVELEAVATALEQARSQMNERDFAMILDLRRTQVANLLKSNPVLGAVLQSVVAQDGASATLKTLIAAASVEAEQAVIFGNLETLNRLMVSMHPELRR